MRFSTNKDLAMKNNENLFNENKKGKVVGSISLKQLIRLCHKNFNCIDGIQVPQSDCLQSSQSPEGSIDSLRIQRQRDKVS